MNKILTSIAVMACAFGGFGCQQPESIQLTDAQRSATNAWTVRSYLEQQSANAVVTEGTIYPHHFLTGTAKLNDLGQRSVRQIASHGVPDAGRINIRRGSETPQLYRDRIETIKQVLAQTGFQTEVTVDDLTGGAGMASEHVLIVLDKQDPVWHTHAK